MNPVNTKKNDPKVRNYWNREFGRKALTFLKLRFIDRTGWKISLYSFVKRIQNAIIV